ncbi:MAG TPA: ABC transporter substrate-binding protein [Mycobacteriales bacterium]|nr:ABC transporter substrate-binding protein [Mycobacteriales bacterium]
MAGVIALAGCGSSSSGGGGGSNQPQSGGNTALCGGQTGSGNVKIAAFNFSESETLANIYAAALDKCGYHATVKAVGAREVVYPALKKGDFAAVPEYAATLTDFINQQANGPNAPTKASGEIATTMTNLRAELPSNLVALQPAAATDKNAFAIKSSLAQSANISTMSQLAAYSKTHPVSLAGPAECPTRPFCEPGLKQTYGMKISKFVNLGSDAGGPLTLKALTSGKATVGLVFTSDPTPASKGLTVLQDDKNLQASDNIVPIVQKTYATGAFAHALNAVDSKLSQAALIGLNKAVELQRAPIQAVATGFLQTVGLG